MLSKPVAGSALYARDTVSPLDRAALPWEVRRDRNFGILPRALKRLAFEP
jgi:hypothetical protein